jgi:ATP-dependent Zn protease
VQAIQVIGLFAVNFLIFMGPMLAMNISQIKVFEPGDVNLGVKFEDVRGQKEAKEDVRRVIEIWESGDDFRALGGKPDKGLLLMGQAGTGKTMLAKAIATSFNAPFVFIPGSGFAALKGSEIRPVMSAWKPTTLVMRLPRRPALRSHLLTGRALVNFSRSMRRS